MAIYEDTKDGKATGRFRIEVQLKGKRLRGSSHSLKEAREVEAELKAQLRDEAIPAARRAAKATLKDAVERAQGLLWAGQSTELASYRKLDRIVSIWGELTTVDDIDANSLDKLIMALKEGDDGLSEATVNRYLSCVSAFLRFCKKRGMRTKEVPELDWQDEGSGRIRWVSYEEEQQLMELLPSPYDTLVYIAIRTGMRASELLSLKPDQVEPSWVRLWKTKNGDPRSVPINQELFDMLWPLVSTQGAMPTYWQLRTEWDKARKAMGLLDDPGFVFHSCRHTCATRGIQAGMNLRVLQRMMGHLTIQTTLRYAHVDDQTLADAASQALAFHADRSQTERAVRKPGVPRALH